MRPRTTVTGLAPAALAVTLALGLLTAPPAAADPPATDAPTTAPAPADDTGGPADHVAAAPLTPDERAPLPASTHELRRDYDDPDALAEPPRPSAQGPRTLASSCTPADFAARSGPALAAFIEASTVDCVNTLFGLTGAGAGAVFAEAKMIDAADGLAGNAASYPGDNSTGTAQLVLFLRAGYYVQWYHPGDVGQYGPALATAIENALDTFFADPDTRTVNDANGEVLAEAVTLIDSARENARYIYVVRRLLAAYDGTYDPYYWMLSAVNNVYTVLFRGHQVPAFVSAVRSDPALLYELNGFAVDHLALLGGDNAFLVANAGRELARFLQHTDLRATVRPLALDLLQRSRMTGPTARLWVGVAEMADYFDAANCSYYDVCNLADRLTDAVLSIHYTCSASIRIRAQDMDAAELDTACTSLTGQDAYFHDVARDPGPVADDGNTTIEVNVFDSSTDYQTYAGAIFAIDTNNGGMYLEGDPTAAGNQPRFIAYEAEWLRPDFAIWNLNHEYTHYLDGRFDMYGDFGAALTRPSIWWVEGFAEYVSYSYRGLVYEDAVTRAGQGTYALSTLFGTTYENADTARVYNWGYLAVRFMLERHRAEVDTVLGYYRAGAWDAAYRYLTESIGSAYDGEWYAWLDACASGGCGTPPDPGFPECTGGDVRALGQDCRRSDLSAAAGDLYYLYVYLPAGTASLEITAGGGTGDCDLYYNAATWATTSAYTHSSTAAGNSEAITVTNPGEGYRYISLYGDTGCSGVSVATGY